MLADAPPADASAADAPASEPAAQEPSSDDAVAPVVEPQRPDTLLSDWDLHLFNEGTHHGLWQKLGAHLVPGGVMFGVWAPNAERVSVVGDFNDWNPDANVLAPRALSGIWEGFIPDLGKGAHYKYHIVSRTNGYRVDKADPFGIHQETPPETASIVWDLDYDWNDAEWMESRRARNSYEAPVSIYEVHLGSWRRGPDDRVLSYRELAPLLADYVSEMGFTHVEFLPLAEHPFGGSWGYQVTSYFAPTSRFGDPDDFRAMVDCLHQRGIGVLVDWVPAHFPRDSWALARFDGTALFEHADPRQGEHPDWGTLVFNYGRHEVVNFLAASAQAWVEDFHIDGLRVDAVASMLYLDYSRKAGEWVPNEFGGRENLHAVAFLHRVNELVHGKYPGVS
ncbi:MAG: 1,4-alpha-glucan branching enzyme, partial [Acidobacteria bacterium]|nr:1,4-alpha-glucan branching enzyme [Acidobacteriota bacterium]